MGLILFRYLFKQLAFWICLTLTIITAFFFFFALLETIGDANNTSVLAAVWQVILKLPKTLYLLLPTCCALGTALGLLRLESQRELVMFRLFGLTLGKLLKWIFISSLLWVVLLVTVSELLIPISAKQLLFSHKNESIFTKNNQLWLHNSNGFTKIGAISINGQKLFELVLLETSNGQLVKVTQAKSASYQQGKWILNSISSFSKSNNDWKNSESFQEIWSTELTPETISTFTLPPEQLSLWQINNAISQLRELSQSPVQLLHARWNRISDWLAIPLLMLATVTIIRFSANPSTLVTRRLFAMFFTGTLIYYLLTIVIRQFALNNNWAVPFSNLLPTILLTTLVCSFIATKHKSRVNKSN